MIRKIIVFCIFSIIVFSMIFSMGCILQDPKTNPSYSVLPEVLLDYDFDTEETKIWVKSALSDFKYDNITIEISYNGQNEISNDNNTYGISISTKQKVFELFTLVVSEEKKFEFISKVDVDVTREDLIIITTYDEITSEELEEVVLEEDLPYKKILSEVKEE